MAVFPLENGVFSGTLLRFNVRGYVYIWSLIFSMFKFFVCCNLCVLIAIYACSSCVFMGALVRIHCICYSLYIYLGEWGNGKWVIKWINWGNGSVSGGGV